MTDVRKVADEADMIVNGYAFTQNEEGWRVQNFMSGKMEILFCRTGVF